MNCENMSYNKEYSSYMSIQNLTDTPYTLYLKAVPVEQSKQSEELLKSINLTLSLNDKVIYNGSADGTVYDLNYPELNNSICLGDIIPSDDYVLSATISLNNDYSITDNVSCQVDWVFYASTIDDNDNNNNSNHVNYSNTSTSKYNHSNSKRVLPIQAEKYPFKTDDCFNYSIIFVWIFSALALIRFYPKKQK